MSKTEIPIGQSINDSKARICDYSIYDDEANVEFANINDIPTKLRTYNKDTTSKNLSIQWGKLIL